MNNLFGAVNLATITGLVVFLFLLLILVFVYFTMRISSLAQRYNALMTDKLGQSIESMLLTRLDDMQVAKGDIKSLESNFRQLNEQLKKCVQRVGVVRFNAFDDTGSDLSFAIALLDEKNNGVVISSIYGRTEARCYAKPIIDGNSTYMLSDEEKQAIIVSKKNKLSS